MIYTKRKRGSFNYVRFLFIILSFLLVLGLSVAFRGESAYDCYQKAGVGPTATLLHSELTNDNFYVLHFLITQNSIEIFRYEYHVIHENELWANNFDQCNFTSCNVSYYEQHNQRVVTDISKWDFVDQRWTNIRRIDENKYWLVLL